MLLYSHFRVLVIGLALFIGTASLSGCGFSPLYATNKTDAKQSTHEYLKHVDIRHIPGRLGQLFKATLEDKLNPTLAKNNHLYHLDITLKVDNTSLAIQRDRSVTRYQVTIRADYVLTENKTGHVIRRGTLKHTDGYDKTESEYAAFISRQDANRRSTKALAQDFVFVIASSIVKHTSQAS